MSLGIHRANNFDAIRLAGAVFVLVGHSYPLHARTDSAWVWGSSISTLGLIFFFSLSGYLISTSWQSDPRIVAFLQKRALRIFPALIVVTLGSIFVLGPIASALPLTQYFATPGPWSYLGNIILWPSYGLPGVFAHLPYPVAVNGSLWSLPAEFACYLMVPVVAFLPRRFRAIGFAALAVAFAVTSGVLLNHAADFVWWGTSLSQSTTVWVYFMVGAAIASAGTQLPLRLDIALVGIVVASVASAVFPIHGQYLWLVSIPYAVICLGSHQTPVLSRAGRYGDLSYGIYLYAFPVTQVVILAKRDLPFTASTAIALAITVALAFGSWHLIEKQALKFKPRRVSKTNSDSRQATAQRTL